MCNAKRTHLSHHPASWTHATAHFTPSLKAVSSNKLAYSLKIGGHATPAQPLPAQRCFYMGMLLPLAHFIVLSIYCSLLPRYLSYHLPFCSLAAAVFEVASPPCTSSQVTKLLLQDTWSWSYLYSWQYCFGHRENELKNKRNKPSIWSIWNKIIEAQLHVLPWSTNHSWQFHTALQIHMMWCWNFEGEHGI